MVSPAVADIVVRHHDGHVADPREVIHGVLIRDVGRAAEEVEDRAVELRMDQLWVPCPPAFPPECGFAVWEVTQGCATKVAYAWAIVFRPRWGSVLGPDGPWRDLAPRGYFLKGFSIQAARVHRVPSLTHARQKDASPDLQSCYCDCA